MTTNSKKGWIGVDFDRTLAHYDGSDGIPIVDKPLGLPVPAMLEKVKQALAAGKKVKIFTARAADLTQCVKIMNWCVEHGLGVLEVTNVKTYDMREFWDDRAREVIPNTGVFVADLLLQIINVDTKPSEREERNGDLP